MGTTNVKVYEVMNTKPVSVSPNKKIIDCAKLMKLNDTNSLIVTRNKKVLGIITEEDFVRKAIAGSLNIKTTPVKAIMAKNPISVLPEEDIYDAVKKMSTNKISQMPVIDKDGLIGVLTARDILIAQPQLLDVFIEKAYLNNGPEGDNPSSERCEACGCIQERNIKGQILCRECATIS